MVGLRLNSSYSPDKPHRPREALDTSAHAGRRTDVVVRMSEVPLNFVVVHVVDLARIYQRMQRVARNTTHAAALSTPHVTANENAFGSPN